MSTRVKLSGWNRGAVRGAFRRRRRHRRLRRREDHAVQGVQDAGRVLGNFFDKLERRCKARDLVAAIRHCDAFTINRLLNSWNCRVAGFYKRPGYDCVKICCAFGRRGSTLVTFDICVSRLTGDARCCF